ncbi:TonB-dependent receptor [Hymenobacter lapidiphilus]|uniref:TonB-dependent receptor n=1 Tax=Hymenobacter sp. CCM 8763 TaxID=2303334 RepID=UPI000E347C68|nr:TonB-dependent receptor [Hymenobacter sp. CCM 8763]RFP66373.1 TonB-dependent receptor [Hymenobacter sp. CCM 8763]
MSKFAAFAVSSLCLLVLPVSAALAQSVDLVVSVVDVGTRQPVVGQVVHLDNAAIGFSTQQTTDNQGKVRFRGLSTAGSYAVSTDLSDKFQPVREANILLRSNSSPSVTLVLPRASGQALGEVTVRAPNATTINTQNAEVASQLSARELRQIPIEARDITRALYRLPNVTQATGFFTEAPNVSINGANGLYTNYLIDGLDNNENFLGGQRFAIPTGFVQNLNVLTNNFSTEYGNSANGIVNVTTKSGSNELSGEAFYLTRPGPGIDGKSDFAQRDLSGNQVKSGFQRQQFGFGVGGALVKDKTFFFLNAEQTFDLKDNLLNSPALGVNESVRGQNRFTYLSTRLDQRWNDRFTSSLRANVGIVNIERQGGGLDGGVNFNSAGNQQDRNSVSIASQNVYVGERITSETSLQYARFRWNYAKANNPNSPDVGVRGPDGQTIAVLGHPGYLFDALENTWQGQQKFTYLAGRNTFKAGFGLISSQHSLFGGGNPNGSYTVQLSATQLAALRARNLGGGLSINDIPADVQVVNYGVELRPASFGTTQNLYNIYLEDLVAVTDRLNLTLGLRYDYDNLSKGGSDKDDFNNIAPRASFNYQLTERSSLRGGFGLFYDKIQYAIYSDALQQNTTSADYRAQLTELVRVGALPADTDLGRVTFAGNAGASFNNTTYLNGPSAASLQGQREASFSNERRILNPNGYQNPYTQQSTLGYQYQVGERTLFYADAVFNRSFNLLRLASLNGAANYPVTDPANVVVRTAAQADASRPIPILTDANGPYANINGQKVRGVARDIIVSETAGRSRYLALNLNLKRDLLADDKYGYRLSYSLSNLKNDTEDINFRAQNANQYGTEYANSINDRTHVFNALGFYQPIRNLNFNVAALVQSGQPINRVAGGYPVPGAFNPDGSPVLTNDLNGDGSSFSTAYLGNADRFPGEGRNSDRLPWSKTIDAGLQYNFLFGEKLSRLEIRADVFNVFNTQNLSGYANNATQSNQIQVGPEGSGIVRKNASAPRQFQFGARYAF